jgi:predicted phosphodiesterase
MKTLIFSDTHLGLPVEEKKYNFMHEIIEESDQVIINGDFWEGHIIEFQQFIESPWKNLFPLLKKKNTIYIHGNHDEQEFTDERVALFSTHQTTRFDLQLKKHTLIFEHGDRLAFLPKSHPFVTQRAMDIERIMVRSTGDKIHKIVGGRLNTKIKKALKKELKKDEIYICGHTHYAEIDKANQFINTGIIRHGLGQYLLIDNDQIIAKEEWYD